MSTEILVTVLTGLGLLVTMAGAMSGFFFVMRKEMHAGQQSLRVEMRTLRTEMQTVQKSLRTEMQAGQESLRTEIQTVQKSLRKEISELRSDLKADYRSFNERLDGTNMRIDRLVDSLREPRSA